LIIALSDGREVNVGEVVAPDLAERIKVISTMSTNGAVGIKDEGTSISTGVKNINFVGATVTATSSGDDVTVNVSAGTGTVTSVGGTGTVNGLTLTGTVTTSGNLTLGGTLNLLSPPAIGGTTPASGAFTTLSATGVTTVQAGTAALPAITTTGDTNTGIFFPAADTIAFTEGGVEAMRIDSSGNVGIGVTPSVWSGGKAIEVGFAGRSLWGFTQTVGYLTTNAYYNSGFKYGGTGAATAYEHNAGQHVWYNAASGTAGNAISFTQAMTLDASGNLGIGTSSPSSKLHVAGTLSATGIASFTDSSDSGQINFVPATATKGAFARFSNTGGNAYVGLDNSTGSNFSGGNYALNVFSPTAINFTAGSTNKMLLDASGNLGIGTTGQVSRISSTGSSATDFKALTLRNSNGTVGSAAVLNFEASSGTEGDAGSTAAQIKGIREAAGTNGALAFWTSLSGTSAERARIDSSGNLLVGESTATGNPLRGMQVLINSGQTSIVMGHVTGTTSGTQYLGFNFNGSVIGSITQSGTTAVLYNTTSDYRLKTVTSAVTGQGARIDALKPIDYQWKESNEQARGFLAHEFQEVYPSSVSGNKDAIDKDGKPAYQSMQAATSEVIADLVAEIQSLRKRLAALELA